MSKLQEIKEKFGEVYQTGLYGDLTWTILNGFKIWVDKNKYSFGNKSLAYNMDSVNFFRGDDGEVLVSYHSTWRAHRIDEAVDKAIRKANLEYSYDKDIEALRKLKRVDVRYQAVLTFVANALRGVAYRVHKSVRYDTVRHENSKWGQKNFAPVEFIIPQDGYETPKMNEVVAFFLKYVFPKNFAGKRHQAIAKEFIGEPYSEDKQKKITITREKIASIEKELDQMLEMVNDEYWTIQEYFKKAYNERKNELKEKYQAKIAVLKEGCVGI